MRSSSSVTAPAVITSADADTVVPPEFQRMVIDAYAGEKRVVRLPEAGHNDPPTGPAALEYGDALRWLWDRVGVPPPATRPATP